MMSLSESVTTMPLTHFLEDEFGEGQKILLCGDAQNSSVCPHRHHYSPILRPHYSPPLLQALALLPM
jgi:hypothetical protein